MSALSAFSLDDSYGRTRAFPTKRPALLCFVKEDCPTCGLSMPLIEDAHRAFGAALDVWAIGQDREGNQTLVERHALTVPMLDDSALKVSFTYGVEIVPTIILADQSGAEVTRFEGFDKADWQKLLRELGQNRQVRRAANRLVLVPGIAPRMRLEVGRAGHRGPASGRSGRKSHQGAPNRNLGAGRSLRIHVRPGLDRRPAGRSADARAGAQDAPRHAARRPGNPRQLRAELRAGHDR